MAREYNRKLFTPEDIKKGLHLDLINYLLDYNSKSESYYYDIHITSEGYCLVVEWTDIELVIDNPHGAFKYVPEDGVIMIERDFPDNHTEMCYNEEDYQRRLKEWLEENPGWVKNEFGCWTNEIENEKFRKELEEMNNGD